MNIFSEKITLRQRMNLRLPGGKGRGGIRLGVWD